MFYKILMRGESIKTTKEINIRLGAHSLNSSFWPSAGAKPMSDCLVRAMP